MTSMPASRRALATTLAPRSCPSSPGLATTTRMRPCATVRCPSRRPFPGPPLRCRAVPGTILPGHPAAPTTDRRGGPAPVPAPDQDPAGPPGDHPGGPPDPPGPGRDPGQVPLPPGRDPGGRVAYLPPRAARARKLILRSQLGRGWILAAALFGLVILVAGVLFLARQGRPGPPWVRVAPVSALPAGAVTETAGPRWDAEGSPASELRDGQEAPPALRRVPAAVAGGDLYVNPS